MYDQVAKLTAAGELRGAPSPAPSMSIDGGTIAGRPDHGNTDQGDPRQGRFRMTDSDATYGQVAEADGGDGRAAGLRWSAEHDGAIRPPRRAALQTRGFVAGTNAFGPASSP